MKEINRFYIMGNKLPLDDGPPVSFKDHAAIVDEKDARIAALQEHVQALAAENENLKVACGGDGNYIDCPGCSHSQYIESPDTPATDAALREIRAQGVDSFSEDCKVKSSKESHLFWIEASSAAEEFAARIRAGEQP